MAEDMTAVINRESTLTISQATRIVSVRQSHTAEWRCHLIY